MLLLVLLSTLLLAGTTLAEEPGNDVTPAGSQNTTEVLSLAEELLRAARLAGYNLTLDAFDDATAKSDEEVKEIMPLPVAEKFLGHRRDRNLQQIRDAMIGMIFTGRPVPLGSRQSIWLPDENRRRFEGHQLRGPPKRRFPDPDTNESINNRRKMAIPQEILKPLPFTPNKNQIHIPMANRNHVQRAPRPNNFQPHRPKFPPRGNFNEHFSNTLSGPDFGPVTFEEHGPSQDFGGDFEDEFTKVNNRPTGPTRPQHKPPPQRPAPARPQPGRPHVTRAPNRFSNDNFFNKNSVGFQQNGGSSPGCRKYTEDICLDVDNYPHEAILSSLIHDPSRADTMIADEESQSADQLVDGISAAMEERYDYTHYFGNRRQDSNHAHRDFADDGGYLCPSEVKYARPKRARNSKGEWKYVVNMDKYTQTIRMEKCLKPGGVCSYVSHHYRATCKQIYNYQRLLSWENNRGLHMDIYKVPSCCSCHIQGYAYVFPPLGDHKSRQSISGSNQVPTVIKPDNRVPIRRMDDGDRPFTPAKTPALAMGRNKFSDNTKVNFHYHPIIDYFE